MVEWTEVPGVRLIHGDCLDVMPTLDAESIDAVVTDPPYGLSFMCRGWDHAVPGAEYWLAALRVAKPGAHLVAFGGTRTYHRLTCAIEDAGWEIRDTLMWLYGTGFPKSHDVAKAIDKEAGAEREVVGHHQWAHLNKYRTKTNTYGDATQNTVLTAPATPEAARWQGWGTALKPAWEPIILARKPLVGTVAENVLTHGTGGINIDACRVPTNGESLDGGRVSTRAEGWDRPWKHDDAAVQACRERGEAAVAKAQALGRWPANLVLSHRPDCNGECDAECPVWMLGEQSGERRTARGEIRGNGKMGYGGDKPGCVTHGFGDVGTAARFFYTPKASKDERRGSKHPTVKPVDVMTWLVKLVCPPGGTVLDPFGGSGTTAEACLETGMRCVLVEREAEYVEDCRRRVQEAAAETPLFVS